MQTRRQLISGFGALICAPAIVRASSLMPVKAWIEPFISVTGMMPSGYGYNGEFVLTQEVAMNIAWNNAIIRSLIPDVYRLVN